MRPIPTPKSLPVFGTMLSIICSGGASKLHLYVDKRHRELGPIYKEKIGPVSGVFIADGNYMRKIFSAEGRYPKHVVPESWLLYNKMYKCERGLLFMDDEEWLKYRRIMNNLMLKVSQQIFHQSCDEAATDLIQPWKKGGRITDLETHLYEWSLKAIIAVLLGCDNYILYKTELYNSVEQLAKTVHRVFVESASLSLIPVNVAVKLKLPVWKRFVTTANSIVEQGNDLVNELLEIQKRRPDDQSLLLRMMNNGVDVAYLKRIAVDLILAAGDTTAHTTQWLLHLLSISPRIQDEIYENVRHRHGDDIVQCPMLKGALKEALRLYPVAPFITRFMPEDLVLDGYRINANELVIMSLYSSGRSDRNFTNPDSFDPGRWLRKGNEYEGVLNPNAFLPFAMGSRSCVGKKMAETQILITVSKILKNFIIKSDQKKRIDIKLHLIAVPAEPVNIILEPRKS